MQQKHELNMSKQNMKTQDDIHAGIDCHSHQRIGLSLDPFIVEKYHAESYLLS